MRILVVNAGSRSLKLTLLDDARTIAQRELSASRAFWYQIKPFSTSTNADSLVMKLMGVLSLAFILVPFLPGVRDLRRPIPIYKLIWRDYYRSVGAGGSQT